MVSEFVVPTEKDLDAVVAKLIELQPELILFYGNLGAGKTTLINYLCKKMGVEEHISSPTFSLVNEYAGKDKTIFHFDLYRIRQVDELFDFGFEEYFEKNALCLVEWPEVALDILPLERTEVFIENEISGLRRISIHTIT